MNTVNLYGTEEDYAFLEVVDTRAFKIGIDSVNNTTYKYKADYGDGTKNNITGISVISKAFTDLTSGIIKISGNRNKVVGIYMDQGVNTFPPATMSNIKMDASFLDLFPNLKIFNFRVYNYGRHLSEEKGMVTGEWATKCGSKMEIFNLACADYSNTNATFNLNLIPSNSSLKELHITDYHSSVGTIFVSGDFSSIPMSCKIIGISNARAGSVSNVYGVIPNWVEKFTFNGRNTISGSLQNINQNITYLVLGGNNTLSGEISIQMAKSLTYFNLSGANTISGVIPDMPLVTNFTLTGNNTITGNLGSGSLGTLLPKATIINIGGNSHTITGILGTTNVATQIIVVGQNTIHTLEIQPACRSFILTGRNTITGHFFDKLPAAINISLTGQNTVNQYTSKTFPNNMETINISGRAEFTTDMIDQILIDLSKTTWAGNKSITIKGNSQPRSSASDAAVAILVSKGVTVQTN